MKKYFIGLMLSGAAARIKGHASGLIRQKKPNKAGTVARVLVGAVAGAAVVLVLAREIGPSEERV